MKDQIFISHVSEDARIALGLALLLEGNGYRTWVFEVDNAGDYLVGIQKAIDEAGALLVVVSPQSVAQPDQVSREITIGQLLRKSFIPVLYDLKGETAYEERTPRLWKEAFGRTVRVPVAAGRLKEATKDILDSLRAFEIQPGEQHPERMREIFRTIDELPPDRRIDELPRTRTIDAPRPDDGHGREGASLRQRVARWREQHPGAMRRGVMVAALVALALWIPGIVGRFRGVHDPLLPSRDRLIVYIPSVEPPPQDQVKQDYEVYSAMKKALSMIGDELAKEKREESAAAGRHVLEVLGDRPVDKKLLELGCVDLTMKNKTRECLDTLAMKHLGVRARVETTFRAKGHALALALEMSDPVEGHWKYEEESADANLTSLGRWGARQIALFLKIDDRKIDDALKSSLERRNKELEDSLFPTAAGPPVSDDRTSNWVPALVRAALAQPPPGGDDRDVKEVLEQLRAALETRNVKHVEPLFVSMPSAQQQAYQRYLDNVKNLKITFSPPEIARQGDTVRATFVRRDDFVDGETGERMQLAIRLVAVLARSDGHWKIESLQKPS